MGSQCVFGEEGQDNKEPLTSRTIKLKPKKTTDKYRDIELYTVKTELRNLRKR